MKSTTKSVYIESGKSKRVSVEIYPPEDGGHESAWAEVLEQDCS